VNALVRERPLRLPRAVPEPATIGIFALSGRVDAEKLAQGVAHLEDLGHRVVVAGEAAREWRYFAGTDEQRLSGFHRLLDDPSIDLMISARGGYGATRLLPRLDWNRVAASGKAIVGFSDFTAFNCAAYACANLLTYHGPMITSDFGDGPVDTFMEQHFWLAIGRDHHRLDDITSAHEYGRQRIEGRIWGGNLSLLAHLSGTPYFPMVDDGILYLEEIEEQPYAVERMIFQLYHAGVLGRQRALLLGDFSKCLPTNTSRYPYCMDEVLESIRSLLPYPVLTDLPFGHVARKATLPFGAPATLTLTEGGYNLRFSGYNVR
jgi:muramoyltetrapeptide carboxypeptidase